MQHSGTKPQPKDKPKKPLKRRGTEEAEDRMRKPEIGLLRAKANSNYEEKPGGIKRRCFPLTKLLEGILSTSA